MLLMRECTALIFSLCAHFGPVSVSTPGAITAELPLEGHGSIDLGNIVGSPSFEDSAMQPQ